MKLQGTRTGGRARTWIHTFTGSDKAAHSRHGGRNSLGACVLSEDFSLWECGCICAFLVTTGYQGSECMRVRVRVRV